MKKVGDSWDEFLLRNHFEEQEETLSKEEPVRRSRRGKMVKTVEIKPDASTQEDSEEVISEKLIEIRKQLRNKRKEKLTSECVE